MRHVAWALSTPHVSTGVHGGVVSWTRAQTAYTAGTASLPYSLPVQVGFNNIKDDDKKDGLGSDVVKPETPIKVEGARIVAVDVPNDPNPLLTGGGNSLDLSPRV